MVSVENKLQINHPPESSQGLETCAQPDRRTAAGGGGGLRAMTRAGTCWGCTRHLLSPEAGSPPPRAPTLLQACRGPALQQETPSPFLTVSVGSWGRPAHACVRTSEAWAGRHPGPASPPTTGGAHKWLCPGLRGHRTVSFLKLWVTCTLYSIIQKYVFLL